MYFIFSYKVTNTVLSSQMDMLLENRRLGENEFKT
jgi:hypothetical protein